MGPENHTPPFFRTKTDRKRTGSGPLLALNSSPDSCQKCQPRMDTNLSEFRAPDLLRACLKIARGAAARDFGVRRGRAGGASPQRAVTPATTKLQFKRPVARRVLEEKAAWLRCSSVEDPQGVFSFVAPCHPAFCSKTAPLGIFRQALSGGRFFRTISAPFLHHFCTSWRLPHGAILVKEHRTIEPKERIFNHGCTPMDTDTFPPPAASRAEFSQRENCHPAPNSRQLGV